MLISGAAMSRGIGIATIPILSRLYSPSDLGIFALCSSTILVLSPISTLGYHFAIPLPRTDRRAAALLLLCILSASGFTILSIVIALSAGDTILTYLSLEAITPYLLFLPFGVFAASVFETMTMWATRRHAFKAIATTQIIQSFVGESLKIVFGLQALGPVGLILGHWIGHGSGVISYTSNLGKTIHTALHGLSLKFLKLIALRFSGFPLTRVIGQTLLSLSTQAPLFFIAMNYEVSVAGQMSIAMLAFMAPFIFIGQAAGRAYLAEISKIGSGRADLIAYKLRNLLKTLALISTPIAIVFFFFAEATAGLLLGEQWTQAGRFVSLLSLALVPQFLSSTIIGTLDVLESHRLTLTLHTFRLLIIVATFAFSASRRASPEEAILAFSIALSLFHIFQSGIIHATLSQAKMSK